MIEIKNLHHAINKKKILENVSFSVNSGKVTALVGPNGSGKSSLIRLISGEWKIQCGSITLKGRSINDWSKINLANCRAVLSQSIELAFDFTVQEVIMLSKTPFHAKVRNAIKKKTIKELLDWIGLPNIASKSYNELSGGEQKRVQIARVLAQLKGMDCQEPRYLLMDEPEAHLDLGWKGMPLKAARKKAQEGVGVLVALHDLNLAAQYADEIVLLSEGSVIAIGAPKDVLIPEYIRLAYGLTEKAYGETFSYADSMALI